jgi:uncharacterized metal-binding protein YceD (DUF177 family)
MKTMKINTLLDPIVPITKYSHDIIDDYELTAKVPWVKALLTELEEENDTDETYPEATIVLTMQITRKTNSFLGDHLIMRSKINASYHQPCGRCLAAVLQKMELDIAAAYLHDSKEKQPEYAEATTVFADNEEMELYFFRKGMVDIQEVIHEQVFMEVKPFPRCVGECKNPVHF